MLISGSKDRLVINTGKLVLEFGTHEKVRFNGLSQTNRDNFINYFGYTDILWRVVLKNAIGKEIEISSAKSEFVTTKIAQRTQNRAKVGFIWRFTLSKKEIGTVLMAIRCEHSSSISYWSLNVTLPKGWGVVKTDFPIIPNIKLKKGLKLAVPYGWGLEYNLKPGSVYDANYPSCQAVMQFVAFYTSGKGLYLGAHDHNANHKRFFIKAEKAQVGFTLTTWAGISKKLEPSYNLPFETTVGVFDGDYYDAAQIYRKFSYKTPWGNPRSISKRHTPNWLKQTELWLRPMGAPEKNIEITKQALDYFGVPTALHWYRWHQIPYDTLYPEYFPALPGFADGIKELQKSGTYVMLYINGRLWDPASKSWKKENAKQKTAALKEDGSVYIEVYGSKIPLAVMCPYTKPWQRKVKYLVDRLFGELKVDGVYIDQIGAAAPARCYNSTHGHPLGGGDFWYQGYRKMLEQIRKELPKNKIVTTEENIECWLDQFDAMLVVNTYTDDRKIIPLFPAVYSDRIILFGFLYYPSDDLDRSIPFRAKTARCFTFGSQLGWIQPVQIMDPKYRKEAEFLRNVAQCRRFAHNFVNYGRFLDLLDVKGDNPRIKGIGTGSFGGTYKLNLPAVMGSIWRANDGTLGILIVNQADKDHKIQINLPLEKTEMTIKKGLTVKTFGSEGLETAKPIKTLRQYLNIPARTAKILQITKK